MSLIDDELLLDAEEDARAVAYIHTRLPQELQERITEEQLYYFLDVIEEYYVESGVLDAQPDSEGFVEIDEEAVSKYMKQKAQKEGFDTFSEEDLLFIAQAELDYQESLLEDED